MTPITAFMPRSADGVADAKLPQWHAARIDRRPRLLFLRFSRPDLPAFLRRHLVQQVVCLERYFHVTVIDSSVDFDEECDRVEPDLVVFESGVFVGQRNVRNVHTHAAIPRLGFLHCDAFCPSRKTALADMARWGVQDFFTTSVALPHYTPEIAGRVFVWPNFVDPEIYRDYGLEKSVPILLTGSQAAHYPWRNAISQIVTPNVTYLATPHFGWLESASPHMARMPHGERYARLINSAEIAPTCGTISMDVVRKHLEIPACNTCLVTERSVALVEAGFEDGVNCVFADPVDILDKLEWLLREPDELSRITAAGRRLVAERHVAEQRGQVHDWFLLAKRLGRGERIGQVNAFLPLTIVDAAATSPVHATLRKGVDQALIHEGDRLLVQRDLANAEIAFVRAGNYYATSEAALQRARCRLLQGDAATALRMLRKEVAPSFAIDSAMEPDPVEWSYLVLALWCAGLVREASTNADRFSRLRHPHLDQVRQSFRLNCPGGEPPAMAAASTSHRATIHGLAYTSPEALELEIVAMLDACGVSIDATGSRGKKLDPAGDAPHGAEPVRGHIRVELFAQWLYADGWRRRSYTWGARIAKRSRQAYQAVAARRTAIYRAALATTSARLAAIERSRPSAGSRFVEALAATSSADRIVWIGNDDRTWAIEASMRGLRSNARLARATFAFLGSGDGRVPRHASDARFDFTSLAPVDGDPADDGPRHAIARLLVARPCGLLAVDFTRSLDLRIDPHSIDVSMLLLTGLNTAAGAACCASFLGSRRFRITRFRFDLDDSYAVFERIGHPPSRVDKPPVDELVALGAA